MITPTLPQYTRDGRLKTGVRYIYGHRLVRGSRQFPNLNIRSLRPWVTATSKYAQTLVMQGDYRTCLFALEAGRTLTGFPARPQSEARNRSTALTPRQRAEAIVWNVLQQGRYGAFALALKALAVHLAINHEGLKPDGVRGPWSEIQVARSIATCLRSTVKAYECQNMRTGEVEKKAYRYRMGRLGSYHVAVRLFQMVEPLYRDWAREHGALIASSAFTGKHQQHTTAGTYVNR